MEMEMLILSVNAFTDFTIQKSSEQNRFSAWLCNIKLLEKDQLSRHSKLTALLLFKQTEYFYTRKPNNNTKQLKPVCHPSYKHSLCLALSLLVSREFAI